MFKLFKTKIIALVLFSIVALSAPLHEARADMDPKVKALATMAAYGTIGGALLGTASLAFGTSGRSVAIGASLGLYTGILFGSYIIVSHQLRKNSPQSPTPIRDNYYPDAPTPYNAPYQNSGPYNDGSGGDYGDDYGQSQRSNPMWLEEVAQIKAHFGAGYFDKGQKAWSPEISMELLHFSF